MRINQEGLDLIKMFEGLRLEAYVDPVGIWTIGYGHIQGVKEGQTITEAEAEAILRKDIAEYEEGVAKAVKVALNENEFSALVSFSFNVGVGALRKSTALRRLNEGDRVGAADALEWWNKGRVNGELVVLKGLKRRRAAEKALFLKPVVAAGEAVEPAPTIEENSAVEPQGESSDRRDDLSGSRTIQGGGVAGTAGAVATAGAAAELAVENADKAPGIIEQVGNFFRDNPEVYVALGIIILLMIIWIIYARIDDWSKHRR